MRRGSQIIRPVLVMRMVYVGPINIFPKKINFCVEGTSERTYGPRGFFLMNGVEKQTGSFRITIFLFEF